MVGDPCILRGPQRQARGAKSEVAASPLLSRRPKRGRKCYVTPALPGVPNAKRREQNQKWLPHPYFVGRPREGANATSPLHSRGVPTPSAGSKIRSGCLTLSFSEAQKRAEMVRHPCILQSPQRQARGAKSEVATSPLLSRRPKSGQNCYVTAASRGSPTPRAGSKIRSGCLTPTFPGDQKRAEMLRHPCILGGPQRQAQGAKSDWLPHPYFLRGPKEGGDGTSPFHFPRSPTPSAGSKIRSGCLTPTF